MDLLELVQFPSFHPNGRQLYFSEEKDSNFSGVMQLKEYQRGTNPLMICILLTFTLLLIMEVTGATYKKPPFNGSIFGKRSNEIPEYEGAGRTLSTLCEIASEACSAWFAQMETKKK